MRYSFILDTYPKRKFVQKLDNNEFNKNFNTDHRNEIVETHDRELNKNFETDHKNEILQLNEHKKIMKKEEDNMEIWDETNIVKHSDIANFPVSTIKSKMNDAGLYSCDNCGKQFGTSNGLTFHV